MTQTNNSATDHPSTSAAARVAWAILILSTLYISYFHNLGAIGLVGPDEPRYSWIARDMVESGDWVTPRLYGQPWFEKPVLYYWSAALSFKFFGVNEASARLPSAFAALFATLAMAWLAWRVYGTSTARWVLLLLPTSVGMIGFSHAAATDMPFAAMLTIAMVFAARLVGLVPKPSIPNSFTSFTSSPSFTSCFFGFFLGLAVLAKGPAAIILSGGSVLLWAICTKRWRDAFRCLHPVAIASFCLTALPWYILCARRNPDFFRVFIIEHNFKRYLTPEFQHIQPFWFYVPIVLSRLRAVDSPLALVCGIWLPQLVLENARLFTCILLPHLRRLLPRLLLRLPIQATRLHPSRNSADRSASLPRLHRPFEPTRTLAALVPHRLGHSRLTDSYSSDRIRPAVPYIPHHRWGDDRDRLCPTRFRSRKLASHSQRPTPGFPLRFNRSSACLGPATDVPLYFPSVAAVRSFR